MFRDTTSTALNMAQNQIKLPIVQIIANGVLSGELICGNNVDDAIMKLNATLKAECTVVHPDASYRSLDNVYSDTMMTDIVESVSLDEKVVLKIYRDGCQKCMKLEPEFYKLFQAYNAGFRWFQAKAEDIPNYTAGIKSRLIGLPSINSQEDNALKRLEQCPVCLGTGAEPCFACAGVGYTMQGAYAVTCSTCGGSKSVRCRGCGGKCLNC